MRVLLDVRLMEVTPPSGDVTIGDSHLAADYALWKLAVSSFPRRLDIEQNRAVPEVTVAWDLIERNATLAGLVRY